MRLHAFVDSIVILAVRFPLSVTSWLRSPAHNSDVGGHNNSHHMLGLAVDVVLDNPADTLAITDRAKRLGLRVLDEGDHLHISIGA